MGYSFLVRWESQRHIWFISYTYIAGCMTRVQSYKCIGVVSGGMVYIIISTYVCE